MNRQANDVTTAKRPFTLDLKPGEAAMVSECEGSFVIEPMMHLRTRDEARADALSRLARKQA